MDLRRITALALAASVALAACGDDDDTTTVDTPAGQVEVDPGDVDTDALQDAVDEDGDVDFDGVLEATGIATKASALEVAMDLESFEVIDDTTLKIFVKSGSADDGTSSIMDCAVGTAVLNEGDTLIVAYPDGEVTCD